MYTAVAYTNAKLQNLNANVQLWPIARQHISAYLQAPKLMVQVHYCG